MDINNLKYIVGTVEQDKPATMRFFGPVNAYSVAEFVGAFNYLTECVKPSKIIVLINSEGGSVLNGMSAFSAIQNSPIEVDCVIEGVAASMGSVIWAAGSNLFMHDYSLLMIHNPFSCDADSLDESGEQAVGAFKHQLSTIYQKRFGFTKDEIASIMDGEGDADGTWFTAKEAIKRGIIDNEHVIKTSKVVRDKVKHQTNGVNDATPLREIMSAISAEINENKLVEEMFAISKQEGNNHSLNNIVLMNENETQIFETISAQLGIPQDAQMNAISVKIAELTAAATELESLKAKYTELDIQFKGKEAEIVNLSGELNEVKASLKKYQDAEQAAFEAKVEATVTAAIEAGKINAEAKEDWVNLAKANFVTVEATLNSIPAREKITEVIATEPHNVTAIENTLQTVEEKTQAKVKEIVGEINLKSFN